MFCLLTTCNTKAALPDGITQHLPQHCFLLPTDSSVGPSCLSGNMLLLREGLRLLWVQKEATDCEFWNQTY